PVVFGRAAGRADENITVMPLGEADPAKADMATCVIVGSAETRLIDRPGRPPLVYAPRSAGALAERAGTR
ncbi:MAG: precorrin-3B C(17)-methyltransferase, partial [Nitratireductor sp.]